MPLIGTKGLGTISVYGFNLKPLPPAIIRTGIEFATKLDLFLFKLGFSGSIIFTIFFSLFNIGINLKSCFFKFVKLKFFLS